MMDKYILEKNIEYPRYNKDVHGELPWMVPDSELVEIVCNRKQHKYKSNTAGSIFVIVMLSLPLLSFISPVLDMIKDDLQSGLTLIGVTLLTISPMVLGAIVIIRGFFRNNIKYKIYEQLDARYSAGEYLVIKCEFLGIIRHNSRMHEAAVRLPNNCCYIGKFDRLKEPTGEAYLVLVEYETEVINTECIILF